MLRRRALMGEESFKYVSGASLICPSGVNFNNYNEVGIHATIMLADNTSWKSIARNTNSAGTWGWDFHFTSSDYGHVLEFQELYQGNAANFQWWDFGPFKTGTWYELDLHVDSSGASLTVNGSDAKTATVSTRERSLFSDSRNVTFGGSLLSFRGKLSICGTPYSASSETWETTWDFEQATVGETLSLNGEYGYVLTSDAIVKRGKE